uniref:Scm like with four mbt domains 1 n=1 Tax=Pavo cristatus TaxID=9049 RepID=A0A8C9G2Z5_PAVCR
MNCWQELCLAFLPDAGSGVEDMEFSWDEYLEDTGAVAAPHGSFKHVRTLLPLRCSKSTFWMHTVDKPVIGVHSFSEGMKLEAVDPAAPFVISPATVLKVYNEKYFMTEIDDLRPERASSHLKNGVHLSPPPGYPGQDFDWADYLKQCGAEEAPQSCFPSLTSDRGFKENMKLEAVNPVDPEEVCIATVTKLKDSYLWLQLEGSKKPIPDCIVSVESMNIFPVGWCETNGYQLRPPRKAIGISCVPFALAILSSRAVHDGLKNQELNSSDSVVINGKYCCPKIYFNHRCFSGPYLNKGRIAELPQSVGPGNCVLVLKEVLTLLINAAYKPSRVLRELQLDEEAAWHGHGETLKAKYKGKSYRATVEVVRTADRVADFCRKTCIKLECCPNLFGPQMVLDKCSENCSVLTKTKYIHCFAYRRKSSSAALTGLQSTRAPMCREIKIEVAEKLQLDSNPLEWSVADVVRFLKSTDCAPLARIFLDQEIDGQALLLLTLPTVQECMDLKLGPAIKLCHHIERVKLAFYQQFAN